jgi:hypothetical protein
MARPSSPTPFCPQHFITHHRTQCLSVYWLPSPSTVAEPFEQGSVCFVRYLSWLLGQCLAHKKSWVGVCPEAAT